MLQSSKLSTYKQKKILGLNRRTIDRFYRIFREKIAVFCVKQQAQSGEFEIDESYFGARRVRGKRGGFSGKNTSIWSTKKKWKCIRNGSKKL